MSEIIAVCPNDPSHKKFITSAHVAQDWQVDEHGNWLATVETYETVAKPDRGNNWTCCICGCSAMHLPKGHPLSQSPKDEELQEVEHLKSGDLWSEYPPFPRGDWRHEVANGDTLVGYWQWVEDQIEQLHNGGYKPCDECSALIPEDEPNMANRFHEETCSLYDPSF